MIYDKDDFEVPEGYSIEIQLQDENYVLHLLTGERPFRYIVDTVFVDFDDPDEEVAKAIITLINAASHAEEKLTDRKNRKQRLSAKFGSAGIDVRLGEDGVTF